MATRAKNFDSLNLSGVNLSGLNLTGASFRNANLRFVDLSNATLDRADFTDADLTRANLAGAQLNGANFTDADLSQANLQGSQLCDAILERACLQGADLNGANLTNANTCNWKISRSTIIQEISDAEKDKSEQQWKKIDTTLDELYQLKGMANRETWNEQFFQKAKDLELPPPIYNHLFDKYYEHRLFQESRRSLRVYLLQNLGFMKLERAIESLNYSIAHLDIFPILDKLQTLSIIGALVLLINGLIKVDYESRYRA